MKKIKGMITAPFTGFTETEEVDLNIIKTQQQMYKDNGINGVFICGSTGEGPALTVTERKLMFKEWAKYKTEDFAVIAFLGGTCAKECEELAIYAAECGLDAIAVTSPYYFKPASVVELSAFCKQVAEAAPQMPFYYYHIPCLNGVNFPMYDLLQVMDSEIPSLAGIKYTYENMMDYQLCLNFKNCKYNIMWGRDEMLLPALSLGATSYVGSTYGYSAPIYTEIINAYNAGDIKKAAELQLQANRFILLLTKYGGGAGKAFMKAIGLNLGSNRAPIATLTQAKYDELVSDLAKTPFDKYKCKM